MIHLFKLSRSTPFLTMLAHLDTVKRFDVQVHLPRDSDKLLQMTIKKTTVTKVNDALSPSISNSIFDFENS